MNQFSTRLLDFLSNTPSAYTIGTGTRTREEFLDPLTRHGIELCIDTRRFPRSRRFPQFTRDALTAGLRSRGIDYAWMGEALGGFRSRGYGAHMRTPAFGRGLDELEGLMRAQRGAILCSERLPWRCHRRFIARALVACGWRVLHIIDANRDNAQ